MTDPSSEIILARPSSVFMIGSDSVLIKRVFSGDKYEAVVVENKYKKYMMLKIRNVSHKDFGSYKCMAKNSLGETDGYIKLDGELSLRMAVTLS
ncbi:hypothetical protein J437_LFUL010310 [Ladona fulva]|uniref:Immunoglobulin I-set domain-containing protein n=1 Tax=Ladona fulva TaxID=123851 RepID=A0A8K0P8V8_LADFU|nr:hypothetical protein J437_LFUL010310 [Ladona fulva]